MSRILTNLAEGVHGVEDAYVNWYLVEEDGEVTVVDTGHPRSWRLLAEALRTIGRVPSDVSAVVLTHGHFDHMGFARRAHRELSVPVYIHAEDAGVAKHPWRYDHERARTPYLLRYPGFRRALAARSRTRRRGPQIVSGAATANSATALNSLSAVAASGAQTVLPGHGAAWRQGAEEIAARAREAGPS
ncbi:MAG TPA: MBL fold metallo-hydrolase [Solirubrobacterales bacterium]|jgi:glyoxylase-like metal-dependent hydrolase (beta-lactamase superfamily II)